MGEVMIWIFIIRIEFILGGVWVAFSYVWLLETSKQSKKNVKKKKYIKEN